MRKVPLVVVTTAATALAVISAPPAQATTLSGWNMDEAPGATVMLGSPGPSGTIGGLVRTGVPTDTSLGYSFPGGNPSPPQPNPGKIVTVPDETDLRPGSGPYSIALRYKSSNTSNGNLVQKGQTGALGGMVKVELHDGRINCTWLDKSWTKINPLPSSHLNLTQPAPVNQWVTVTCARTGSAYNGDKKTTLTVNGQTTYANRWVGTIDNNWVVSIGGKPRCSTSPVVQCDYYAGMLDYVNIASG